MFPLAPRTRVGGNEDYDYEKREEKGKEGKKKERITKEEGKKKEYLYLLSSM